MLRCPSRLLGAVLLACAGFWHVVSRIHGFKDVLRARKRSSERTAMAFMSRTETGVRG